MNDVFSEKISIFTAKIFDDLFLSSARFSGFCLSFPRFSDSLLCYMSYMTLSSQEKHLFYSVHTFARIHNTTSQNIRGDGCMGRPPTSNFWGTVPQHPHP